MMVFRHNGGVETRNPSATYAPALFGKHLDKRQQKGARRRHGAIASQQTYPR